MEEIWKDAVGFEQAYKVSNFGRVMRKKNGSIAALRTFPNGYKSVLISPDGTGKTKWRSVLVHRMVAMAFIPNPDNLPQINHKDKNKANNCVDNLEWCTVQYNNNYLDHNALMSASKSNTILQLDLSGNIVKEWKPCAEKGKLVDRLKDSGFNISSIQSCCIRKCKTYKGFRWCYKKDYDSLPSGKVYFGASIPIVQMTLDGIVVKHWDSTADAERAGYCKKYIKDCCKGNIEKYNGYRWEYLEDYEREHGIESSWKMVNTTTRSKNIMGKSKKENA